MPLLEGFGQDVSVESDANGRPTRTLNHLLKLFLVDAARDVDVPTVAAVEEFRVGEVQRFKVPVDIADGDWMLLRIADPEQPNETPGPEGHPCNDLAVAYTSPWWLQPR